MRALSLPLALATLLFLVPTAVATGAHHGDDHPDPGFSPSFFLFPTHEEVVAGLEKHKDHHWVDLVQVGTSGSGRPIQIAIVTDPESPVPMAERVRTFIFTQQHGNEPAGTPAALKLLDDITAGAPIADTLVHQVLILLPMANPDGATANRRHNDAGHDINRDHMTLITSEANILHQVLNEYDPHVAMDHHEYGGVGIGEPVPVRLYDYDLTTLFPVHGNVRLPVRTASEDLMYEGIWPAAKAAGFNANEYGEQTVNGIPVRQIAGGPDPGIMRNHMGLHNMAGLLVETRVDAQESPFHDANRRIAIHSVVMEATLTYVHENAEMFKQAKREGARLNTEEPMADYLEGARSGPLAEAYRIDTNATFADLVARHGIAPGIETPDGTVHNMVHEHQGHLASLVHPQSSRNVIAATATEPIVVPEISAPKKVEESPVAPVAIALLALALAALSRRAA